VCVLLAKRGITTSSIQMLRDEGSHVWTMQVVIDSDSEVGLDLVVRHLSGLVSVVSVDEVGTESHNRRQSVFVTLEPTRGTAARVGEIARMFSAEVVVLTPEFTTLHLAADPDRCDDFVSVLEAYNVTDVDRSAISGTVTRPRARSLAPADSLASGESG